MGREVACGLQSRERSGGAPTVWLTTSHRVQPGLGVPHQGGRGENVLTGRGPPPLSGSVSLPLRRFSNRRVVHRSLRKTIGDVISCPRGPDLGEGPRPYHGLLCPLRAARGVSEGRPGTTPKAPRADSAWERPFSKYFLSRFGWRQSQPVRGLGEQACQEPLRTAFVKRTPGAGLAHTQAATGQAPPPSVSSLGSSQGTHCGREF